jgi:hypothetical protein
MMRMRIGILHPGEMGASVGAALGAAGTSVGWASAGRSADARNSALKAWRFATEMREIAATFEASGLPGRFHSAAADIYQMSGGLQGLQPRSEAIAAANTSVA